MEKEEKGIGELENPSKSNCNESESEITDADADGGQVGLNLESSRTPFTNLSQVDADLALARTLQEQERAYMMLRINSEERASNYGSSEEAASYVHQDDDDDEDDDEYDDEDEDDDDDDDDDGDDDDPQEEEALEFDNHTNPLVDPSAFASDEAFARALQDAEDRELAARMMALSGSATLVHDWDPEDNDTNSQDTWEEFDPDELSYEELLALGEVVGTESRGLSADKIASLPSVNYKAQSSQDCSTEQCVICRLEYEDEDPLIVLSCKHIYHSECINNWLQINKVCPVCSAEVSTSDNR